MRFRILSLILLSAFVNWAQVQAADEKPDAPAAAMRLDPGLQQLAAEFFAWREAQRPFIRGEITRATRPDGWLPAWSPEDLAIYRVMYRDFLERLEALDSDGFSRTDEVDARLLAAQIKRAGWELDALQLPHRNPRFYVDQTLGPVFEVLVSASPPEGQDLGVLLARLRHVPVTLAHAVENLDSMARPFALAAIDDLKGIETRFGEIDAVLGARVPEEMRELLSETFHSAGRALADFRTHLQRNLSSIAPDTAIGPEAYQWYLAHVALIPYTLEEVRGLGRHARERSIARRAIEAHRNRELPPVPIFESIDAQVRAADQHEREIRAFLTQQELLSVPETLPRYRQAALPDYLAPLAFLGATVDLASAADLGQDAIEYRPPPAPDLPWFAAAAARDPRLLIVHRGIPGAFLQRVRARAHTNPIRRHALNPDLNAGITAYMEHLVVRSGLWEFSPQSREFLYALQHLYALQVEADIGLATGELTLTVAGARLAAAVPMDRASAAALAAEMASNPGRAIGHQIGVIQIMSLLAERRSSEGPLFSLREFHDDLLLNANVPVTLQVWERLDRRTGIDRLDDLGHRPATVPR